MRFLSRLLLFTTVLSIITTMLAAGALIKERESKAKMKELFLQSDAECSTLKAELEELKKHPQAKPTQIQGYLDGARDFSSNWTWLPD